MTKEQLRQYQYIKQEKEQLEQYLEELETLMTSPRAQSLDGMPFSPSKGESVVEILAIKHLDIKNLYRVKVKELAEALCAIEKAIETLEPLERTLMRLRYIDGLKWEEVAVAIDYSWQQTHRLHKSALEKLREVDG